MLGWDPRYFESEVAALKDRWTLESKVDLPDVAVHVGRDVADYTFRNVKRPAVTLTIGSFDQDSAWEHLHSVLIDSANVFLVRK